MDALVHLLTSVATLRYSRTLSLPSPVFNRIHAVETGGDKRRDAKNAEKRRVFFVGNVQRIMFVKISLPLCASLHLSAAFSTARIRITE